MKKKLFFVLGILVTIAFITTILPEKIDCGHSEIYTLEEREAAVNLVADKVRSFEGCKLFFVRYDGDAASQENLSYCNELAEEWVTYIDCIVITSYFRSPIFGGGAWNANHVYEWSWYLARTAAGEWEIITYGYA